MFKIAFNGKFFSASPTGVHRVADELMRAIDDLLQRDPELSRLLDVKLIVPRGVQTLPLLPKIRTEKRGLLSGLLKNIPWEQINLPWLARGRLLISFCNLGPLVYRPSVTMIHDAQVYISPSSYRWRVRAWHKFLLPSLGRSSGQILTVSDYSKEQLARYGIAPQSKIAVVHNGCDHVLRIAGDEHYLSRAGLEEGRFVLALSNTQPHKNIGILLRAFQSEALNDVTLVLFGATTKEDFERAGHKVPANIRFVGRVSDAELVALMRGATAFACPSITEGFGLPALEAMALGRPVIVAPCGALPEVCGDAAIYADPDDPSQWISAVQQLLDDDYFRADVCQRSSIRAAQFTWRAAARKLLTTVVPQISQTNFVERADVLQVLAERTIKRERPAV